MNIKEKAYKHITQLKDYLNSLGYNISEIEQKDYNYEFIVYINKKKLKVQVYFGKKGIKTIIQGDNNSREYYEIRKIIQLKADKPMTYFNEIEFDNDPPMAYENFEEPHEYIGTDECGKGDYFGPLVVAAVYVNTKTSNKLKQIGVRDSKELNENQITYLSKEIKKIINNAFEIIVITPDKYNELYDKFRNLNTLLNWAHSKAIKNLFSRNSCKIVITDKFSNKDLNISLDNHHSDVKFIQVTGGEIYTGVAAASILARNAFNEWFLAQTNYGINLVKGSSANIESYAQELIRKVGKDNLKNFAKLHFKTTKNILHN